MRNLTAHAAVAVLFLASCTGSNPKPADSTATKDTAVAGTNRAADTAGTIVDIQDARQTSPPANNPADHKDRDVVVFRMTHQRNGQSFPAYQVSYYRKERDTMRYYQAIYGSTEDFSKAACRWVNDTLLHIRLFSPASKKEVAFDAFGHIKENGSKISGMTF